MSTEKRREEASRWLRQAGSDLEAAQISLTGGKHEWACFQAQQAAEKAVKAAWFHGDLDPWGHSIRELIARFPKEPVKKTISDLIDDAAALDKLHIPTRYPNGLPDIAPVDSYTKAESEAAIAASRRIFNKVRGILK